MYRFTHDDDDGILEIGIEGSLTLASFPAYAQEFRQHVREVRLCGRPLRVLIDVSRSELLATGVADRIARLEHELFTSALDRVAVVTPSALRALQARHIATSGRTQTFATMRPARQWLLAFAHHPMRRAA